MRSYADREPLHGAEWRTRTVGALSAASLALTMAACAGQGSAERPAASSPPATVATGPMTLIPDMTGFLKPGSSTTCFNGGPRPCAILVRTQPELAAPIINADPAKALVTWPRETYAGRPGDGVIVCCYTTGQTIHPYEGAGSSAAWYEVEVPDDRIQNPTVRQELAAHEADLATIQQGGQLALIGYASVEWFHQDAPDPTIPACTA